MAATTQALPREMSRDLFRRKPAFDVSRLAAAQTTGGSETSAKPAIGQRMPDRTVYAGLSPDTGRPMFVTPNDSPLTCNFNDAVRKVAELVVFGHRDWRMPTKAELNELFKNRAAIGGFDTTGSNPTGWYWSSSRSSDGAWTQRFSDGYQGNDSRDDPSALRCVRG